MRVRGSVCSVVVRRGCVGDGSRLRRLGRPESGGARGCHHPRGFILPALTLVLQAPQPRLYLVRSLAFLLLGHRLRGVLCGQLRLHPFLLLGEDRLGVPDVAHVLVLVHLRLAVLFLSRIPRVLHSCVFFFFVFIAVAVAVAVRRGIEAELAPGPRVVLDGVMEHDRRSGGLIRLVPRRLPRLWVVEVEVVLVRVVRLDPHVFIRFFVSRRAVVDVEAPLGRVDLGGGKSLRDGGLRDAGTRERGPLDLGVRHAHRRGGRGAAILRGHRRERLLQLPSLAPVDLGPLLEVWEVALGEDGGDALGRLSLGLGDRAR